VHVDVDLVTGCERTITMNQRSEPRRERVPSLFMNIGHALSSEKRVARVREFERGREKIRRRRRRKKKKTHTHT